LKIKKNSKKTSRVEGEMGGRGGDNGWISWQSEKEHISCGIDSVKPINDILIEGKKKRNRINGGMGKERANTCGENG